MRSLIHKRQVSCNNRRIKSHFVLQHFQRKNKDRWRYFNAYKMISTLRASIGTQNVYVCCHIPPPILRSPRATISRACPLTDGLEVLVVVVAIVREA